MFARGLQKVYNLRSIQVMQAIKTNHTLVYLACEQILVFGVSQLQ